jgi:hypothetical protein
MMRNIPWPSLMEETLDEIRRSQETDRIRRIERIRREQSELSATRAISFKERTKAALRRIMSCADSALECDGPTSIVNLERMTGGTRSSRK